MSNQLSVQIYASKTYLTLSIGVYLLGIFCAWVYFYTIWLSLSVSVGFSIWLFYFLPKLQLTHPNSVVKISLDEDKLAIERNDQSTQQYVTFHRQFQSRFLVIISAGKESIVIFKDALTARSLSKINKYFNAHT
ncbi:MAG: hypothetical protein Ctma_0789 [Catillopecten margaritatus gill symbiont]|uniref:YcxB-like protein domain-containing protein n=1 Tax=Catillopecten margaritatus gill symbiont TaxID=3083288 RepID=A0AAU6PGE6_9GAMM